MQKSLQAGQTKTEGCVSRYDPECDQVRQHATHHGRSPHASRSGRQMKTWSVGCHTFGRHVSDTTQREVRASYVGQDTRRQAAGAGTSWVGHTTGLRGVPPFGTSSEKCPYTRGAANDEFGEEVAVR